MIIITIIIFMPVVIIALTIYALKCKTHSSL